MHNITVREFRELQKLKGLSEVELLERKRKRKEVQDRYKATLHQLPVAVMKGEVRRSSVQAVDSKAS